MPDNVTEFLWWALNGAILLGVWFAQNKLSNIEKLLEKLFNRYEEIERRLNRLETRCGIYHGEDDNHPMRRFTDIVQPED